MMAALLVLAALVMSPAAGASASQQPSGRAHTQLPFGRSFRPVCGPATAGHARCFADVVTASGTPGAAPLASSTPFGYGPRELQSAYKLSVASASSGSTQTVAIVDAFDDPTAESDLATYRAQYGLPTCTTANGCFSKVDQRGGTSYPIPDPGWSGEIALDTEMVSAICPNCKIVLVEADNTTYGNLGAAVDQAAALGATQITNSYGGREFPGENTVDSYYDHPGIAVTVSSGDSGYGAQYPAASPYVTAVGGTSLTSDSFTSRGWTETVWTGAGSGCSRYEPKSLWQTDPSCSNRTVADVSAVADPSTGVAVYSSSDGGWVVYGGTSASSPIVAAYDALIGPAAASPEYPYANPGSYFDVTSGSNGFCGGSDLCTGGPGYDGPTGIGTPDGANLAAACAAPPTVTSDPANQTVSAPAGASFTAAATNTDPNCHLLAVQWQVSTDGGSTFTDLNGETSATLDITPTSLSQSGSLYRGVFTNELGPTDTNAATLTVNPAACSSAPTIATNPANQTVFAPTGASFTAAATNTDPSCHLLAIQWQVSTDSGSTFTDLNGETSATLKISPTSTSQSGNEYRGVFTNELGPADTTAATLTVNPAACSTAPTIATNPANQTVFAPTGTSFTAAATNTDPNCRALTVQWQVSTDGGITFTNVVGGLDQLTLSITPTSTAQSGNQYRAVFTNELGRANTAAATLVVLGQPPDVNTGAPTSVTSTSATMTGAVSPNGSSTGYYFQYGTTSSYGSQTPGGSTVGDWATHSVTAPLFSLSGATTYHFRLIAVNAYGTQYGGDHTLTTLPPVTPPPSPTPPTPPSPTRSPHITGASLSGSRLTVSTGAWTGSPDAYDYAWFNCPNAAGGCSEEATSTESYITHTADMNGQVYAEVRAHNSGGWSGFARSDNQITPAKLTVGRIKVAGTSATVTLSCRGATGARCQITMRLTVTETVRGRKLIAVSAARRPKATQKLVLLASATVTLRGSRTKTVKVTLGARSKRLLARLHTLNVKLTVTQSGSVVVAKTLNFKGTR